MVEEALLLCANAHRLYLSATPDVRRQLNQAVFDRFWIIDDQVHGADLTETFAQLLAPDLTERLSHNEDEANKSTNRTRRDRQPRRRSAQAHSANLAVLQLSDAIQRPNGPLPADMQNPGHVDRGRGSNIHTLVDLVRAYSKHLDLAERLVRTVKRVRKAQEHPGKQLTSVRSTGRSERQWRVSDRLSAADVRQLVNAFDTGTPKWKLAEQYDVSESSVKRLIRRHRRTGDSDA